MAFLDLTRQGPVRVLLGTPSTGQVSEGYLESVFALLGACDPDRVLVWRRMSMGSNICENQNTLIDMAEDEKADYVLLWESDVAVPAEALARLLVQKKEIIGATTLFKEHDLLADLLAEKERSPRVMGFELDGKPITFASLKEGQPGHRVRKVAGIPMGFTLIKASAFDKVRAIVADRTNHAGLTSAMENPPKPPLFRHAVAYAEGNRRGKSSTTDMTFCGDARDAGLDIWLDADLSLSTQHLGMSCFGIRGDQ